MVRLWRGAAAIPLVAATLGSLALRLDAAAAVSGRPATVAAETTNARRATPRLRVSLIGDSVAASIGASLAARQQLAAYDLAIDARVCRRTAAPSCQWRGETAPSARDVVGASPGDLGDIVVLATGYNDDPRRFRADAAAVLRDLAAAGVSHVVWLDLRVPPALAPAAQARERAINATLAVLDRVSPVLRVAPWNGYSTGHDDWFFDPIHLRSTGAVQLARFIGRQIAGVRPTAARAATAAGRGARCRATNATGVRPGRTMGGVLPRGGPVVLRPARVLLDTRPDASDAIGRQLGGGRVLRVAVGGRTGVPQSATAAMVRVQVLQACGAGTVTVGGCGLAPTTSVPAVRGRVTAVAATVPTGTFGRVCVRATAQVDIRVQLLGWSVPA